MPNQKLENLLNLSLEISPGERALSQELETGYMPGERAWELIVKYSGSLDAVREMGVRVEEMRNEYAILIVPENLIDQVSALPQIEYVEKPKRLFFAVNQGRAASCITGVQNAAYEQKDPLLIYKFESFELFRRMIEKINREVISMLLKVYLPVGPASAQDGEGRAVPQAQPQQQAVPQRNRPDMSRMQTSRNEGPVPPGAVAPAKADKRVGRNDPCPCGSGKKYKNCHGAA